MNKYTHFPEEVEKHKIDTISEHSTALCYVIIVGLSLLAIYLNFSGLVDLFINSFGN